MTSSSNNAKTLRCFLIVTMIIYAFGDSTCNTGETGSCAAENQNMKDDSIFKATDEWQEVLPGQSVEPGLWIRMDLKEQKKYARLMPKDDYIRNIDKGAKSAAAVQNEATQSMLPITEQDPEEKSAADDVLEEPAVNADSDTTYAGSEMMYEILARLPEPPKLAGINIDEAHHKMSKEDFKKELQRLWKERQMILKEAIESMDNDVELLRTHLERFTNKSHPIGHRVAALQSLESLVQDMDRTNDFNKIGGLGAILHELNSSSSEILSHSAWVLGTAVKNHPSAQKLALDGEALPKLLRALQFPPGDVPENKSKVRKKCLYALGSLVRANPPAHAEMLVHDGTAILENVLTHDPDWRVKMKVVVLMMDMLVESPVDGSQAETLKKLQQGFKSRDWCLKLPQLLHVHSLSGNKTFLEKLLEGMIQQAPNCLNIFREKGVLNTLTTLQRDSGVGTTLQDHDHEYDKSLLLHVDKLKKQIQ